MKRSIPSALSLLVLASSSCNAPTTPVAALSTAAPHEQGPSEQGDALEVSTETYTLPNGMTVVLHEDHSVPKVVINTWFAVGSKDEAVGRTGFAHLFEHLMFMGTGRVPDNQFDVIMESSGGWNNATTSTDRTNYFSEGPSAMLPTLLWLDADRLDALPDFMTQEKLDKQRAVVRNERRQTTENVPYGKSRLLLPEALFPQGHPYHHPIIGSHEDLEAATVEDVVSFFHKHYVPGNASLVVAGDFDPEEAKRVIAQTFGAIPAKPVPTHRTAPAVRLDGEKRIVDTDNVEFPKLYLAWHSPAYFGPGDAEMDMIAAMLAGGPSTRLEQRLVLQTGLAQEVDAAQWSRELGSSFQVEAVAAPGADLETIKREILAVLEELQREGPTEKELARVKASMEADFLRNMERLGTRADRINAYRHYFGVSDGFQRDIDRFAKATAEDLVRVANDVFTDGRVDLRIYPEGAASADASLDDRPADFPSASFEAPKAQTFELSNGVRVHAVPRPGTRIFSGQLVAHGGESLMNESRAGLASLAASLMNSGAGGKSAAEFAEAVEMLGASLRASAARDEMLVSVEGLTSRMDATLDLFADLALRPNLDEIDFEREKGLALAAIQARKDDPRSVASNVARALVFPGEARGRPLGGFAATVGDVDLSTLRLAMAELLRPDAASLVFVGDFEVASLRKHLEDRFGGWKGEPVHQREREAPRTDPDAGRLVLVHRDDAPQTVIYILRPVGPATGTERAVRDCVNTVFGGSFTSRLNTNIRERNGFSYGAGSRVRQEADQFLMLASSSVFTDKTGAALREFKSEFDRMAKDGIDEAELKKSIETRKTRLIENTETTSSLTTYFVDLVANDRPLDSLAKDLAALEGATLESANALARSGLYDWNRQLIVLVGDREAVLPQLKEAGFPMPMHADADGRISE